MDINQYTKIISNELVNYWNKNQSFENKYAPLKHIFSTACTQCIKCLNIDKNVQLEFAILPKTSFGSTILSGNVYKITINERFLEPNNIHYLLITLSHELRHVYQSQINFDFENVKQSILAMDFCNNSILDLSKSKLGINPYYFYFTSKIEHDAREFSFKFVEEIIKNFPKQNVSASTKKQIENFTKNCLKYINKENYKHFKYINELNTKEQKIKQKITKTENKILNNLNKKSFLNRIFKNYNYYQLELLSNISLDNQLKLKLMNDIKLHEDARLASILLNSTKANATEQEVDICNQIIEKDSVPTWTTFSTNKNYELKINTTEYKEIETSQNENQNTK